MARAKRQENAPRLSYQFSVGVRKGQEHTRRSGRKALTQHCHFDAGLPCLLRPEPPGLCLHSASETVPAAEITPDLHPCALLAISTALLPLLFLSILPAGLTALLEVLPLYASLSLDLNELKLHDKPGLVFRCDCETLRQITHGKSYFPT